MAKATAGGSSELAYPQLAGMVGGHTRIRDVPPLIYHPPELSPHEFQARIEEALLSYRELLSDERRELLDQYRLVDVAIKVVGVGSVGTLCALYC